MLFSLLKSNALDISISISISTRKTERVRLSCVYAYAYVECVTSENSIRQISGSFFLCFCLCLCLCRCCFHLRLCLWICLCLCASENQPLGCQECMCPTLHWSTRLLWWSCCWKCGMNTFSAYSSNVEASTFYKTLRSIWARGSVLP